MSLKPGWHKQLKSLKGMGPVTVSYNLSAPVDWPKVFENSTITCLGVTVPVTVEDVIQTDGEVSGSLVFTDENYKIITKAIEEMHNGQKAT